MWPATATRSSTTTSTENGKLVHYGSVRARTSPDGARAQEQRVRPQRSRVAQAVLPRDRHLRAALAPFYAARRETRGLPGAAGSAHAGLQRGGPLDRAVLAARSPVDDSDPDQREDDAAFRKRAQAVQAVERPDREAPEDARAQTASPINTYIFFASDQRIPHGRPPAGGGQADRVRDGHPRAARRRRPARPRGPRRRAGHREHRPLPDVRPPRRSRVRCRAPTGRTSAHSRAESPCLLGSTPRSSSTTGRTTGTKPGRMRRNPAAGIRRRTRRSGCDIAMYVEYGNGERGVLRPRLGSVRADEHLPGAVAGAGGRTSHAACPDGELPRHGELPAGGQGLAVASS